MENEEVTLKKIFDHLTMTRQNKKLIKQFESKSQQIEKLQQSAKQLHMGSRNTIEAQRLQLEEARHYYNRYQHS